MRSDTDRYKVLTEGVVNAAATSIEFVPFASQTASYWSLRIVREPLR